MNIINNFLNKVEIKLPELEIDRYGESSFENLASYVRGEDSLGCGDGEGNGDGWSFEAGCLNDPGNEGEYDEF